jgi:hypothetical protein
MRTFFPSLSLITISIIVVVLRCVGKKFDKKNFSLSIRGSDPPNGVQY